MKDFEAWMKKKMEVENKYRRLYYNKREIWWCALGINIGAETDGKNDNFERPVVIMNVYGKKLLLVLPITSKRHIDEFHFEIIVGEQPQWVKLTQTKTISSKRLVRKFGIVDIMTYSELRQLWNRYL